MAIQTSKGKGMAVPKIDVRTMCSAEYPTMVDYFHNQSDEDLIRLGVDRKRLPARVDWLSSLREDQHRAVADRDRIYLTWLVDDTMVGFSSVDKIKLADCARMHLHVIDPAKRARGIGTECVIQSVRHYFELLNLLSLFCEPHAYNTAPHRALQRAGFRFEKTYLTTPGPINFEQPVTRWRYR